MAINFANEPKSDVAESMRRQLFIARMERKLHHKEELQRAHAHRRLVR